jgi:phospholipid transport system transporter-binding protein
MTQTSGRQLTGELSFDTVPALWREVRGWFDAAGTGRETDIELSGVTRADSAGLALLIELQRLAHARGNKLRFLNAPAQLLDLIRANGLETGLNHATGTA